MQGQAPHVVVFPLPLQGPINAMIKLAELLCAAGIRITFINTHHSQRRLFRLYSGNGGCQLTRNPNFTFHALPDGLSEDHPRAGKDLRDLFDSICHVGMLHFRDFLMKEKSVTCIIADGIFASAINYAEELNIPLIYFDTISPACVWIYLCLPKLTGASEIPFPGGDLDGAVNGINGMEGLLRRRDLPGFCRETTLDNPTMKLVMEEAKKLPRAKGLVVNTAVEIELPGVVSNLRAVCPSFYAIGPLHSLFLNRQTTSFSSSLWEEDRSCISWLDHQPPKSVVYVSIGSLAVMTAEEALQIWRGLADSECRFLWVQREGFVSGGGLLTAPADMYDVTRERGCVVKWAPQAEVLGHMAVAGFLTHGGWNSTLESAAAGVPMICWPYFVDQQVNSRLVEKVWGLGLDMKDTCRHDIVENMVRDLMERRRQEFRDSASRIAAILRKTVIEDGSSWRDLNRLIDDIRSMNARGIHKQIR